GYVGSMTLGHGQYCTKPGVLFVPTGGAGNALVEAIATRIRSRDASVLLNAGLAATLAAKVAKTSAISGVQPLADACAIPAAGVHAAPRLFVTDDRTFFDHDELRVEHF